MDGQAASSDFKKAATSVSIADAGAYVAEALTSSGILDAETAQTFGERGPPIDSGVPMTSTSMPASCTGSRFTCLACCLCSTSFPQPKSVPYPARLAAACR